MNLPNIFIVGPSGSGKSTSLQNMPPLETAIIDCELKNFPFRGGNKFTNYYPCKTLSQIVEARDKILNNTTGVKYLVFESFTKYTEILLATSRESNKGYDIYSFYNRAIRKMLDELKNDKVMIILTGIDEIVKLEGVEGVSTSVRRISVAGKEHEGKIEKEFLIVLWTEVIKDKEGKIKYQFKTNSDGVCSAKSPAGMLTLTMENDLLKVIQAAEKYYV